MKIIKQGAKLFFQKENLKEKKILKQGAEAILYVKNNILNKERIKKNYRIKEIDDRFRRLRTRSEGRLLMRAGNTPKVFSVDEEKCIIKMEFLKGRLVKDIFDSLNIGERERLCKEIGGNIAGLHNKDIIHGDLTTSNMIIDGKLYFIDFGLGFISSRIEDKAVDLRLLKQALDSKHYKTAEESFKWVLEGYKECNDYMDVMKQLEKVELRGRYKRKHEKENGKIR